MTSAIVPPAVQAVYEDAAMLVVNKPAGLVCHPSKAGPWSSLIGRLRLHLGPEAAPQLINRLDRETSGLVVAAKTPEAARELRLLWEHREVVKDYQAITHGVPAARAGVIEAPLGKDLQSQVAIKDAVCSGGVPAETEYRLEREWDLNGRRFSLLQVTPRTGRKHQIRIHLAWLGHPIVGDKIYGGDEAAYLAFVEGRLTEIQRAYLILPHQALHAGRLAFPWRGRSFRFQVPPEGWFADFLGPDGNCFPSPAPLA